MIEAVPSAIPENTIVGSVPGDAVVYVDHLNHFFDHKGEPKGEQELSDMAMLVNLPQSKTLYQCADKPNE